MVSPSAKKKTVCLGISLLLPMFHKNLLFPNVCLLQQANNNFLCNWRGMLPKWRLFLHKGAAMLPTPSILFSTQVFLH
jgi:hypothetical protein